MSALDNSLAEALAAIIKPIVKEAIREAMGVSERDARQRTATDKTFLTVKQTAETSGLGSSTIRLLIRKRQPRAQKVGRRVLIKRSDLERFLEANPIEVKTVNFAIDVIGHDVYIDNMTKGQFKELREAIDYSQAKLAKKMGVTIRTITRWETGEFPIPRIAELALRSVVREALGRSRKPCLGRK